MRLETKRLSLSIITSKDARDIFETLNDEHTASILSMFNWPLTLEQAQWWCKKAESGFKDRQEFMFIARNGSQNIGCISLHLSRSNDIDAEVGYWISKNFQGQGYATEILERVLSSAAQDLALHTAHATTALENQSSARVLEKCGFTFAEEFDLDLPDGTMRPSKLYKRAL